MASIGISPKTMKSTKMTMMYIILTAKFLIHPQRHLHICDLIYQGGGKKP